GPSRRHHFRRAPPPGTTRTPLRPNNPRALDLTQTTMQVALLRRYGKEAAPCSGSPAVRRTFTGAQTVGSSCPGCWSPQRVPYRPVGRHSEWSQRPPEYRYRCSNHPRTSAPNRRYVLGGASAEPGAIHLCAAPDSMIATIECRLIAEGLPLNPARAT